MPSWNHANLDRHHRKRTTTDAGCFESLMGISGRTVTLEEYAGRSIVAHRDSWAEYEGESRDIALSEYLPRRACFVDEDLVVAITDTTRIEFVTCFHEHFGKAHGVDASWHASPGQRRLRYREHLDREERGGLVRNVRRIRGV